MTKEDPRLQMPAIRERYNDPTRFTPIDSWHLFTAAEIRREISQSWDSLHTQPGQLVLNAGAGGNDLGLCPPTTINLDISEKRIAGMSHPVAASVEKLPIADSTISIVICIGSVINYCDAAVVIAEFGRVLQPGGYLLLEFDSSDSAEFITHDAFRRSAAIVETFYAGEEEALWLYSPKYIKNLLSAAHIRLLRSVPIHVLSPWILLFCHNIRLAAAIARLDRVARYLPLVARLASNHLFFCQKRT